MAQTAVDIVVKVVGDQKLKQLDTSLRGTAANSVKAATGLDRSAKSARNLGSQARRAEPAVSKLGGAIRGLVTAAAVLGTAKFVIGKTAELETQTRSLQVLTGELAKAEQIIGRLQKFAAVTPFTSSELIETSKRLAAFGVDTEKLVETTKRLADVSGATGAALDGVATAYGQIVAKGRLQGEELLQLQERGIGIQEELQKMYGLTGEEFRKALEKGKISAAAVELAIKRLTAAGGKYADGAISQSDTLAGKFSTLQDGIENLARTIGSVLSPAIKFVLDQAIQAINMINKLIGIGQKAQKFGLDQAAQKGILDQARREAEEIVNLRNIQDPFERNRVFQKIAAQRESDLLDKFGFESGKLQVEIEPVVADNKIPELLQQTTKTGGSGSSGGGGGAGRESRVPDLQRELALAQQLEPLYGRIAEAKLRGDEETVIRLQGEQALLELKKQEADILASNAPPAEKLLELEKLGYEVRKQVLDTTYELKELEQSRKEAIEGITQPLEDELELLQAKLNGNEDEIKQLQEIRDLKKQILDLDPNADTSGVEAMVRQRDAMREQVAEMEKTKELVGQISGTIASEFTGAIRSVIDGTKSAEEAMSDMLKGIGEAFINMALKIIEQQIQMIINGLIMKALGLTGGFGSGASAPSIGTSTNYFSGGFTPMSFFADGGRPSVGEYSVVGERGPEFFKPDQPGRVISNEQSKAAMSRYSASNDTMRAQESSPIVANVNYNGPMLNFNGDEYIPRSEASSLVKAGAKQGEAMTLARLQNSRSSRAKLGL